MRAPLLDSQLTTLEVAGDDRVRSIAGHGRALEAIVDDILSY